MKPNHAEILVARNKTKLQHKVYLHEAAINMLDGFCGASVSKNICAIVYAFLQKIGKDMSFIDNGTAVQIREIRRAIAD